MELNSTVDLGFQEEASYQTIVQPAVIQPLSQKSETKVDEAPTVKIMNAFDFTDRETNLG